MYVGFCHAFSLVEAGVSYVSSHRIIPEIGHKTHYEIDSRQLQFGNIQ